MCIILKPVRSVTNTKIFVAPSLPFSTDRQLTVYLNSVNTLDSNMMILPVPYPDSLKFEKSVMEYKSLFEDLHASLRWLEYLSATTRSAFSPSNRTLPVFTVGSYSVSVAQSVQDLNNLNTSVFSLPLDLKHMLEGTYGPSASEIPFGFLCCKLRPGLQTYEPIAYSHRRIYSNKLFVPTKHYHAQENQRKLWGFSYFGNEDPLSLGLHSQEEPHWDHIVYSIQTIPDEAHHSNAYPKQPNSLDLSILPKEYQFSQGDVVHCWEKKGRWKNDDLLFSLVKN
jgi:hypothetical protein